MERIKSITEVGNVEGRGKLVELHEKKDQFGLGYQLSLDGENDQEIKGNTHLVEEIFESVGHILDGQITMIDEEAYNEATSSWIRPTEPDEELKIWKAVEIPQVFYCQT